MLAFRAGGDPTGEQFLRTNNQLQWLAQVVAHHCQNRLVEVVGARKSPIPWISVYPVNPAFARETFGSLTFSAINLIPPRGRGATSFASGCPAISAIEHP